MPFSGDLRTISLVELLQWAGGSRKDGVLELERNRVYRRIAFREGRIVACSSNDPANLLGRFLVSRGRIRRSTLDYILRRQETTGESVPDILEDIGVMSRPEILTEVAAKAEDTIHGLFEWDDAVFRFQTDATLDSFPVDVDLSVQDIILRGAQRSDELAEVRKTFTSSGIVLERTDLPIPKELESNPLTFQLLELISGERTLAEILLYAPACEYQALKLLKTLHTKQLIKICEVRPAPEGLLTLLDDARPDEPTPLPRLEQLVPERPSADGHTGSFAASSESASSESASSPDSAAEESKEGELHALVQTAVGYLSSEKYDDALTILEACCANAPNDRSLKQLVAKAEEAYLEKLRGGPLNPQRFPVRATDDPPAEPLRPTDAYILSSIDGKLSIQSILWGAPLQELAAMRSLQRLLAKGYIRVEDAAAEEQGEVRFSETKPALSSDAAPSRDVETSRDAPPSTEPSRADDQEPQKDAPVETIAPSLAMPFSGRGSENEAEDGHAELDPPELPPLFSSPNAESPKKQPDRPEFVEPPSDDEGNLALITQPWGESAAAKTDFAPELDALADEVEAAAIPEDEQLFGQDSPHRGKDGAGEPV
jgi:hypothetical protein